MGNVFSCCSKNPQQHIDDGNTEEEGNHNLTKPVKGSNTGKENEQLDNSLFESMNTMDNGNSTHVKVENRGKDIKKPKMKASNNETESNQRADDSGLILIGGCKYTLEQSKQGQTLRYSFVAKDEKNQTSLKLSLINTILATHSSLAKLVEPASSQPAFKDNSNSLSITPLPKLVSLLNDLSFQHRFFEYVSKNQIEFEGQSKVDLMLGSPELTNQIKEFLNKLNINKDKKYDDTKSIKESLLYELDSLKRANIIAEASSQEKLLSEMLTQGIVIDNFSSEMTFEQLAKERSTLDFIISKANTKPNADDAQSNHK